MHRTAIVASHLTGEPVHLDARNGAGADLAARSGLDLGPDEVSALSLAPGVVLLQARGPRFQRLELRWVDAPATDREGPCCAIVMVVPDAELPLAPRLASRLAGVLRDPELIARARAESNREGLAVLLRAAEERSGDLTLPAGEVRALMGTPATGLDHEEATRRAEACGANQLQSVPRRALALRLLDQLVGPFALLLWVAGGLAAVAGMPQLGIAIVAVILVNGAFSFLQEYRAERALEALQRMLPALVTVIRGGTPTRVPADALVPGDLVHIEEGDQVPADGQLVDADGLSVDQSLLTGESHPVFKVPVEHRETAAPASRDRHECVFAGTGVLAGRGTFVVTATGMHTEIGAIARVTQAVAETTSPLQFEMARITRVVTRLSVSIGGVFFAIGMLTAAFGPREGFLFALGVIVANVPEGMMPTLTLALALGAQRLARRRALVRRLSAVETLGATTVICTDKTGTLTENRMTLGAAWVAGGTHEPMGSPPGAEVLDLLRHATLASLAGEDHGDPIERPLVAALRGAGGDPDRLFVERPMRALYPFDSWRKRMTVVRAGPEGWRAHVKGAPRLVLERCTRLARPGGEVTLDAARREAVLAEHDRLASRGLRLLAVASRPVAASAARAPVDAVERDLVLHGLVALRDPPRSDVAPAIDACRRAGIRVVMVTGDDGLTARAIAAEVGIEAQTVVAGVELDRLGEDGVARLAERPGVLFARASPAHKLAIVRALRARGHVVTVTGDGVNDAPALRAADVGVAMGGRASAVAREAAMVVVTDDRFASIVAAIAGGRAIRANVGKFVTYIFSSNVPELLPFLAAVLLHVPLPLTVMQVLAVDLGTDLVPALALGAEPAEPGIMDRPPPRRAPRLLNRGRLMHAYGFLGPAEGVLALSAFFWTYWLTGWRPGMSMAAEGPLYVRATTMTLAGIVAAQVGNAFACRTERESVFRVGLGSNRLLLIAVLIEIGILLALMHVPPLARWFGLAPLGWHEWAWVTTFPPLMLGIEEARKAWVRWRTR